MDPVFVKGMAAFLGMFVVFVGACYLLLLLILGPKLGYFVLGSCFFAVMVVMSLIWVVTGLGPKGGQACPRGKGCETAWTPAVVSAQLTDVKTDFGTFPVSDYPDGQGWLVPNKNDRPADLGKKDSTQTELDNLKPVMDAFVGQAVSPIPGKRKEVEAQVLGPVKLESGKYQITDVRMKQAKVAGKESLIAIGRAVASDNLTAGALSNGAKEGVVADFIAKVGDTLQPGDPVLSVKTSSGEVTMPADKGGKLLSFGLRKDDKIKQGVPFGFVDITGQPGVPEPVQVSAIRVRGSVRTPALYYLFATLLLFALHMGGLARIEKAKKLALQPA
ncbi:MAG: hypothetical protein ABR507_04830 [Actinomycetota bacterium]|nr:hypothetical protein [Actinomycetota bacterium]